MKEFMMIFRNDYDQETKPSPEQMQAGIKKWQDWIGSIAAQAKFVSTNRLTFEGKTLNAQNEVTDGPYVEIKEMVGGYIIVKAQDFDDALVLAKGCPILLSGGKVEIRQIQEL